MKIAPEYVLDRMQMYEVKTLLKYSYFSSKNNWEQARFIAYIIAASNSTKKIEMKDLIEFPWESEKPINESPAEITKQDFERLKQKAEQYLKNKK